MRRSEIVISGSNGEVREIKSFEEMNLIRFGQVLQSSVDPQTNRFRFTVLGPKGGL